MDGGGGGLPNLSCVSNFVREVGRDKIEMRKELQQVKLNEERIRKNKPVSPSVCALEASNSLCFHGNFLTNHAKL